MANFQHISCEQLNEERTKWILVDIRDEQSFNQAHVEGALSLNNDNVPQFLQQIDSEQPVAVMCYHGISSQQAADFLFQQGIVTVASVDGGFEHWRQHYDSVTS